MSEPGPIENTERYVLFYSEKCGQSHKFIELLREFPHINACFEKMEVEMLSQLGKLPPQLTHTPGIIDGNQLLMGANAFKWLEKKTKDSIGKVPSLASKSGFGNMGFSFIGESESEYNPGMSSFDKPVQNGNDVDPAKFDSRSGQPNDGQASMTYNPNINSQAPGSRQNNNQHQSQPQSQRPLPPGLESMKTNMESSARTGPGALPAGLQSQTVTNDGGKLTDGDMERYMANRDQYM
jgi:hypothetical protein